MNTTRISTLSPILAVLFSLVLIVFSPTILFAANDDQEPTASVIMHPAVIREQANQLIYMNTLGSTDRTNGPIWQGSIEIPELDSTTVTLVALTDVTSWIEFTCPTVSSAVGVQFWGDGNDGMARLLVDGIEQWYGTVGGESVIFEQYVEVRNLPLSFHTIRVEVATASTGHVTIAAFGCVELDEDREIELHQIFLPTISG